MLSHASVWAAIDRLAQSCGYSTSGLAKKAGLDPTTFNRSKRLTPDGKERWPSTESLSRVLAVTETSMSDFVALMNAESALPQPDGTHLPCLSDTESRPADQFDGNGHPQGPAWTSITVPLLDLPAEAWATTRGGSLLIAAPLTTLPSPGQQVIAALPDGTLWTGTADMKPANALWTARILWIRP